MNDKVQVLPPDPGRMIEGLRDTGYEFNTSVADIVDNSIAAHASLVDILLTMDFRGEVRLIIADNGCGMNRDGILNAMKYGSRRRADAASLGKFGLGLKTASTAFCRRLSVVSRLNGNEAALQATWDLDHVVDSGDWELLLVDCDQEALARLNALAPAAAGTAVVWDKVDRLFSKEYANPAGAPARSALKRLEDRLRDHLAMVYQRFLDPNDRRASNVAFKLNGEPVLAWDPFCIGYSDCVGSEEKKEVELEDGTRAAFSVRAFVLPRKEEFGSPEAAKLAKITNDRQGIYVYREQRLIHDADWLGMFQKEPHFSLIRVEFSFDHHLDEAFHVDIKKSRILLNEVLYAWLKDNFLPAPRRAAEDSSRKGQRKQAQKASRGAHSSSNANIADKEEELTHSTVSVIDAAKGEVEVTNRTGKVRLVIPVTGADNPGECYVKAVDQIDDGLLWEPALIDTHQAVLLNTGHPYYHKVYVPNLASGVLVQGMDSLMWALCASELSTVNESSKRLFADLRFEVSRLLRRLVEDLPDPSVADGD